ncbi:MAG: histidine triad nucleotide-binding protein [Finegoldia sp.]|nr:histidine triad nucleotide-binding protein [Finegoldia sp.]
MDCVFCKIISGEIPTEKVYEDEKVLAFKDNQPQAPIHVLVIPKEHISCANDIDSSNSDIIKYIFELIPKIANDLGIAEDGYRIINNCGDNAGQTVQHLHFHILGGKKLNVEFA